MAIRTKPDPDPGGKAVDVYDPVEFLRTLVFNYGEELKPALVRLLLNALVDISHARSKRVRDRDLPVRIGEYTNSLDMRLLIIGLPYDLHSPAFKIIYDALSKHPTFIEVNSSSTTDFNPKPFVRYNYGKFIWYADPFTRGDEVRPPREPKISFEIRGCELKRKTARKPYHAPEPPEHRAPKRHSEKEWAENRVHILRFVESLKDACGYKRLVKIIHDNFGIFVYEENSPEFAQYGLIRLSSSFDDKPVAVRILIQRNLDDRLKYVVLAHELAHYVLHFPMLLLSQLIEQLSWAIPELEQYYLQLISTGQPTPLEQIEEEADDLASFFLIPPWIRPLKKITGMILEGRRSPSPEEMVWRFLQPLFPEDQFAEFGWNDLDEIRARALRDSIRVASGGEDAPKSLFYRMLGAILRVEKGMLEEITEPQPRADWVYENMQQVLQEIGNRDPKDARSFLKGLSDRNAFAEGNTRTDFAWSNASFCRELVPPLIWNGIDLYPRTPLDPALYNPAGLAEGDWKIRAYQAESPAGTLQEWREWKPDHGLVLYRLESWQRKYLARL
jgi:hypothetical protein